MPTLTFNQQPSITINQLAVAGMAGRNQEDIQKHIDELKELNVPTPSQIPIFFRCSATTLTQEPTTEMLGEGTSGEVEVCLLSDDQGKLWVTVVSDHTDRDLEAYGIAESKQICAKPVGTTVWPLDDVLPHWDELAIESYVTQNGERTLYQQGKLAELLEIPVLLGKLPPELVKKGSLAPNTALLCGTIATQGGIRPGELFEMSLIDPVRNERIDHRYSVATLPIRR